MIETTSASGRAERLERRLRSSRGQGTVEYVGIVLAVAALLFMLQTPLKSQARGVANAVAKAVTTAISDTVGKDDATPSTD